MRTPTALPSTALLTVLLTACAPLGLVLPVPSTAAEPSAVPADLPPSELSAEGPLLCVDGERDGDDCTVEGTLRWSVPLEGDHRVETAEVPETVVFDTRSRLSGDSDHKGLTADGALYYFDDDLLRVHDLETGEGLWQADLRGDVPQRVVSVEVTGDHLLVGLDDGRHRSPGRSRELVTVERSDGTVAERATVDGLPADDDDSAAGLAFRDAEALERRDDDPRQYPLPGVDFAQREAVAGLGMGVLDLTDESGTELVVGVACAPDSVRAEDPELLPGVARCDNARLFAVNR